MTQHRNRVRAAAREIHENMLARYRENPHAVMAMLTDVTLERACKAFSPGWNNYSDYQKEKLRPRMRRALEAFLFGVAP